MCNNESVGGAGGPSEWQFDPSGSEESVFYTAQGMQALHRFLSLRIKA